MPPPPNRIEQTLTLAMLAVLITGCFLVLRPFLTAVLWAVVLAATTWPLYARMVGWLGGRTAVAAAVMTLLIAAVVLMPFVIVGVSLAENVGSDGRVCEAGRRRGPAGSAGVGRRTCRSSASGCTRTWPTSRTTRRR